MKQSFARFAWRLLIFLLFSRSVISTAPVEAQADYEFNDSHFHLTNNVQDGPSVSNFLKMMGNHTGRAVLSGIPLQQQWSYRLDGERAPTYYLHSDAPLYYYSFTDAWIAMAYRSLPKQQQARFDPMITGFNPADMYAADHIRRVLTTFPGVFSGIGEFTIHKEFVSAKIAGKIVGALDVQSTEANAFSSDDIEVLSILADQVALAIQNARLFEQTQQSLKEAEAVYRQYVRETWSRLPQEQKLAGFRYSGAGVVPLEHAEIESASLVSNPPENSPKREVVVPIVLREEKIGELAVQIPGEGRIKSDHMDVIKAVAERVALSVENARLFEETTRRAERERLVSDITTKIRGTNNPQDMIRTAMEELQKALGATRVEIVPHKSSLTPDK